jgi:hypothetical protein
MSRNRKFATTLKLNDFEFSLEAASLQNLVFGTHATKVEKIAKSCLWTHASWKIGL